MPLDMVMRQHLGIFQSCGTCPASLVGMDGMVMNMGTNYGDGYVP